MSDLESRNHCVGCGTSSPATETNYTLIGPQYGWRVSRSVDPKGRKIAEWHCPKCWARRRSTIPPPMPR
jgi:hypothetical protein